MFKAIIIDPYIDGDLIGNTSDVPVSMMISNTEEQWGEKWKLKRNLKTALLLDNSNMPERGNKQTNKQKRRLTK